MASISVSIEVTGLDAAIARLAKAATLEFHELLDGLSALGVAQTQRRIQEEKTTPEGAAWAPTLAGGSILFKTGSHLSDTIDGFANQSESHWGTGWIGARVHQFGAVIRPVNGKVLCFMLGGKKIFAREVTIPARAYLGLSPANATEMSETAVRFVTQALS